MKILSLCILLLSSTLVLAQTEDSYRLSREGVQETDDQIQKRVANIVAEKTEGTGAKVTVSVKDGHVIFGGTVETGSQRYVLHSLGQKLDGIKSFEITAEIK